MPDRLRIYCEGPDDRVVLEHLQRLGLLAADLEIAKPTRGGGYDQAVTDANLLVAPPLGGAAIVVRDYDTLDRAQVGAWLEQTMRARLAGPEVELTDSDGVLVATVEGERPGRVAAVPAGLPALPSLRDLGITGFAVDDFILLLSLRQDVYAAVTELAPVPFEKAVAKLHEIRDLMDANGLPLEKSKRFLQILRAVTGFPASGATYADRVLLKAEVVDVGALTKLFEPLVEGINAAAAVLRGHAPAGPA